MKKLLNKKGFTLVELMVVVAIMGVLVAIAVPVYGNVTEQAERTVCQSNMRTYDSAIMMWHLENMTDNDVADLDEDAFTEDGALSTFVKGGASECPAGGSYGFDGDQDNTTWTIVCTEHGAEDETP